MRDDVVCKNPQISALVKREKVDLHCNPLDVTHLEISKVLREKIPADSFTRDSAKLVWDQSH